MADLYSLQGQEPEPLPEKVRLLDSGLTVRVTDDMDPKVLEQCGYTGPHAPVTDFDRNTQKCVWSSEDLSYVVVDKSATEKRNAVNSAIAQMRVDRDDLLNKSDKSIMPWLERGLPAPEAWQKYRQALRDLPTKVEDPFRILWPAEPMPHEVEEPTDGGASGAAKPRTTRRRKTT